MQKIGITLLLSIILLSSGCTGNGKNTEKTGNENTVHSTLPTDSQNTPLVSPASTDEKNINLHRTEKEIKLVRKKEKTKYLLSNGIEINYQDMNVPETDSGHTPQPPKVYGLKDKKLLEKLNQTIAADTEKEKKEYFDEVGEDINYFIFNTQLNANNLLSISFNGYYSPPSLGFLYRLTDGKRLFLKDIFTEGTDYISLINRKVTEGILKSETDEEDFLREPFSSIKPDQDFALSDSKLYIIFKKGESGFAKRTAIGIPLSEIDDYVDVLDRFSGTERKTHERTDLIVRRNNNFIEQIGEITHKKNGKVFAYFPKISGLRDDNFEAEINKTFKDMVSETLNSNILDNLTQKINAEENRIANIYVNVLFNHYGILTVRRNLDYNDGTYKSNSDFYSFNLLKKKRIDTKKILENYIKNHKDQEDGLTKLVKNTIDSYGPNYGKFTENINYSFIMNNSIICFENYNFSNDIYINITFKGYSIEGSSDPIQCSIPLKSILKVSPEEFFAG